MAARADSENKIAESASSPPAGASDAGTSETFLDGTLYSEPPPLPPKDDDHDAATVAANVTERAGSLTEDERNRAPGILDRRRTTRPGTASRTASGGSQRSVRGRKGLGPNIPIKISNTMADVRSQMKAQDTDGDVTPGGISVGSIDVGRYMFGAALMKLGR